MSGILTSAEIEECYAAGKGMEEFARAIEAKVLRKERIATRALVHDFTMFLGAFNAGDWSESEVRAQILAWREKTGETADCSLCWKIL
jgi:hypothetical protein